MCGGIVFSIFICSSSGCVHSVYTNAVTTKNTYVRTGTLLLTTVVLKATRGVVHTTASLTEKDTA